MRWAKACMAGGLLLLAVGFGLGTEPSSTSVAGHSYGCTSVIPSSWLVAGAPGESASTPPRQATALDRRVAARCATVVRRNTLMVWGVFGLGGLVLLVGWTALREGERSDRTLALPQPA